ncbi:MAG: class I adenylate-forming enzyme family protein [bacterium]
MLKLEDILDHGAAGSPHQAAVIHDQRQISYRQLRAQCMLLKRAIEAGKLPAGSRIGLLWDNSIEYVTAYFAISAAGHVIVPIDTSLSPERIAYLLNDCRASGLFIQGKYTKHLDQIAPPESTLKWVVCDADTPAPTAVGKMYSWDLWLGSDSTPENDSDDDALLAAIEPLKTESLPSCSPELAAIFYTSGSTGTPKGVMLSHRNLISNTVATVEYLGLTAGDSVMVILPFYYIYGNSLLLTHALCGGTLVIDNRFAFPQVILKTMAEKKVTGFSGVPSNFMLLLGKKGFSSADLPHLRYLTQAGGAMAPDVIRRTMEAFDGRRLFIMYGQTEASPRATYCPPDRLRAKIGSIGIGVPGITIHLLDNNGRPCGENEVGEIVLEGPNVMMGYWNQPDEQEQVLRDGRLFTGDLARRDEDGYLYIVSRKKEIIKVGGNRVSAKEVEECLLSNPDLREAAVISVPDDILGEAIRAFVVRREGSSLTDQELKDHCRLKMAVHKVPKYIEFVDSLPKYQSGKVDKQALQKSSEK